MNFTSFHFLVFFLITLIVGHLLKDQPRGVRLFLLVSSYYFYGVFKPEYLFLIFISTFIDYLAALGIESSRDESIPKELRWISPKAWLGISIALNLGILGFFKYTNFGLDVLNEILGLKNTHYAFSYLDIVLPVGISFYTFQSMSYTIDVYRGIIKPRKNFVDFALYVSFFPQLVAGPIVRAKNFFQQMDNPKEITFEDYKIGFSRILMGYFKKLVLADNLAKAVNTVFANPSAYHPVDIWIASLGFGWQIYLDFSGYTDIARGVARFFGYEFEINFQYPMAAQNITEHWKRWHISLTSWLRDYLYIPLGGSRVGPFRMYFNILVVWFVTGLWHGADYHFIAWGLWQYVMIVVHRLYDGSKIQFWIYRQFGNFFILPILSRVILFFSLNFGFIWFRAETLEKGNFMIGRLFGFENITESLKFLEVFPPIQFLDYGFFLALLWGFEFFMNKYDWEFFLAKPKRLIFLNSFLLLAIVIFSSTDTPNFLYFQF
ncbi:MAG: MBOAT family protein [Leptospiraceae bacterium]|nr:MBOAT family protein [Leptospiraceae bacterium]MDW7976636.1 MBOAT family O-acyltransferase [Leptospiraceae bacterium]